ncbi:lytic transglycosylase domain-containing protein [Sphingomonas sp. LaA6.9]|uniref:lytic transglycosylase domain-containing protein n=1 Tax=Sphingomonas sp. LaA6.9 TaxID=2919914 RepID=UPI001F4F9DFE|nr:lytic transglycosylase domain-containing protein [Sphingomonas sp. LaA6.9]MCJ8159320.1 lytic transglycosylase domain-containing protein [Sphingomonas sp. LaA6.9]
MSSMVVRLIAAGLLFSSTAAIAQNLTADQRSWYRAQINGGGGAFQPPSRMDPTGEAVVQWNRLRQSDSFPFSSYASFLMANPGWPGESAMRKTAEGRIDPTRDSPQQVTAYFARQPALTATGDARNAVALAALGKQDEARAAARRAWLGGALPPEDEARILGTFSAALSPADHDARMEKLLWDGSTSSAVRQLSLVSGGKRQFFDARIAMQTRAPDAAAKASAIDAQYRNDPGYIVDRAGWLRNTSQVMAARALLSNPRNLTKPPLNAEEWYETLLTNARGAANDRQYHLAYSIASRVDDGYAPGTDVRDRPIGERDDYTSLVWLAGMTAMQRLGRPADAIGMFRRYATAARSPQTQSKGYYWAARAALAAGRGVEANGFFGQAAGFPDQFYGQLALERLGRPIPAPTPTAAITPSPAQREAFFNRSVVKAARLLGEIDAWRDQTQFLRTISADAKSNTDHHFATELASQIRRPDLAVMIGRSAGLNGHNDYVRAGFPVVSVPSGHEGAFTMIHAITRQESQFDREAVSHAGARGLMQLMPGTARETAGKLGMSYDIGALTADPSYNIRLGSTYFGRMLSYFGGSYPLAVAAYNAGPGNVNKWLAANGDPRAGGVDILEWIEAIPLFETRNYVQRVLENAVVYDAIHPDRARSRGAKTPLSWYLGKRTPG